MGSNFCSSCGGVLDARPPDSTTITFHPQRPADAPDDDVTVDLQTIPVDLGMLIVKRGSKAGSRFALDQDVTTAGRHPESDIFLDDITVSRHHAEVIRTSAGYEVRDAGSLNGTYLNRERIERSALGNGDELQVGKFKLVFFLGPSDE
jgi:pSer/pThr/pTyr-binding forkhead associated (FHA) protein